MVSEEHELIRQTVRQFAQTRVEPQAMAHDESGTFNVPLFASSVSSACSALPSPKPTAAPVSTRRPHASCTTSSHTRPGPSRSAILAHALLFVNNFYWAGNEAQRKRYSRRCSPASTSARWA
jgi:isovaleryl-CoA dehydrogenase